MDGDAAINNGFLAAFGVSFGECYCEDLGGGIMDGHEKVAVRVDDGVDGRIHVWTLCCPGQDALLGFALGRVDGDGSPRAWRLETLREWKLEVDLEMLRHVANAFDSFGGS